MLKSLRAAGVALALLVATLAGAAPATAVVPTPGSSTGFACLDQEAGYQTTAVCQLVIQRMAPACRDDIPWLDYSLQPKGTPNTTATITFGDPNGEHVTYTDLPLEGSIMWPGTVLAADGTPTDWPGWRLENGQWKQGDEYSWARPAVTVHFTVNPEAELVATYPPATQVCSANPPTTEVLPASDVKASDPATTVVLAETGSAGTDRLLLASAGVLLAGSLLLGLRAALRRRAALR